MNLNKYQTEAYKFALPKTKNITYMMLGIANEAGEAAGKLKKVLRGDRKLPECYEDIAAEIGDVLWYCAGAATQINRSLGEIAKANLKKLEDRQLRGKLQGDGDSR